MSSRALTNNPLITTFQWPTRSASRPRCDAEMILPSAVADITRPDIKATFPDAGASCET